MNEDPRAGKSLGQKQEVFISDLEEFSRKICFNAPRCVAGGPNPICKLGAYGSYGCE